MTRLMKVGIALMIAAGTLLVLLEAIALANIKEPTSWTWATLSMMAFLLLAAGSIVLYLAKEDKKDKEAVARAGGTTGLSRKMFNCSLVSESTLFQSLS